MLVPEMPERNLPIAQQVDSGVKTMKPGVN
jgi:hypothetical protein